MMKEENGKNETVQTQIESLDAAFAAPEHHRIVYENDRVRITELKVKAGEIGRNARNQRRAERSISFDKKLCRYKSRK